MSRVLPLIAWYGAYHYPSRHSFLSPTIIHFHPSSSESNIGHLAWALAFLAFSVCLAYWSLDHRGPLLTITAVSGFFIACLNIRACSSSCDGIAVTEKDGNSLHAFGSGTRRKKLWAQNLRCQCGRDARQVIIDLDHPALRKVWASTFWVNRDILKRQVPSEETGNKFFSFHQKFRKSKE